MSYNDVIYSIYQKERYGIITSGCDKISVQEMVLQELNHDCGCKGIPSVIPAENMTKTTLSIPSSTSC